ncbi:MAG: HAMP domain-containing histidine kinase [Bacteroidetes bacterium]|nr:HAMP domain-containing histidine kinase [Bacteroidota bacterium]
MNTFRFTRIVKPILLIFAVLIGVSSLLYTNKLSKKLAKEEELKIKNWAKATEQLATSDFSTDMTFILEIVSQNTSIPVILTDEMNNITSWRNLDSLKAEKDNNYLVNQLENMKEQHEPIVLNYFEGQKVKVYYKNSKLLTQIKYYPLIQLLIITFFLIMSYMAFSYSRKSEQNLVWVGMSKETAHQLGTPISSLIAWIEILKSKPQNDIAIVKEIENDVKRLSVITERFSKIGSEPILEPTDIIGEILNSISYLKPRTSKQIEFKIINELKPGILVELNKYLFAWAIENLTKNSIDAMNGVGVITYHIKQKQKTVIIDVIDTGKGIPSNRFKSVFKPGYTTKKRGWGLGLSFVKRIIDNYHKGHIFVKESTINKGTIFRIILNQIKN